jgi:ribosome-associated protein
MISNPSISTYKLNEGKEFIPLDKLLKLLNFVGSGGEAHIRIDQGEVLVNGKVELQRRKKMRAGDIAEFRNQRIKIEG